MQNQKDFLYPIAKYIITFTERSGNLWKLSGLMPEEELKLRIEEEIRDLEAVNFDFIMELAGKLDFIDIQLLRKFYMTGKEFPSDTQPFCFPVLYKYMKEAHQLKIGLEALRKRLDILVKCELLLKVKNSNPTCYFPMKGRERMIRAVITKFFLINGLTNFL
jgi:hypothetical protein